MTELNLTLRRAGQAYPLSFSVKRMVNAGFVGRDQEAVGKHIQELKKEGISAPDETPVLYPVASYLITTGDLLEVVDESTSGEAEFVLLLDGQEIYVGVGSDHTDRTLEASSILKAKQICPNVISQTVWHYDDIKEDWDQLILRAWAWKDGVRTLYQQAELGSILSVDDILSFVNRKVRDANLDGMVIYSGTVPVLGGEMIYGDSFEVELQNPKNNDSLSCKYNIKLLDYLD